MINSAESPVHVSAPVDVLCVGSVLWDVIGRAGAPMAFGNDRPGRIRRHPGGVALNVAKALRQFGLRPAILSAIGQDVEGRDLLEACQNMGLNVDYILKIKHLPTDVYMAVEAENGLIAAIADTHSLEAAGSDILLPLQDGRLASVDHPWTGHIVLDGNLTGALLTRIAQDPLYAKARLYVAPASPGKVQRINPLMAHPNAVLYVNIEEASLLCGQTFTSAARAAKALLDRGVYRALITDGACECADAWRDGPILVKTPPQVRVVRVTGAGDTFMAAHIAAEQLANVDRPSALLTALQAAANFISSESGI
jgi:sugar/nucleoside kinase (ribokinase family)